MYTGDQTCTAVEKADSRGFGHLVTKLNLAVRAIDIVSYSEAASKFERLVTDEPVVSAEELKQCLSVVKLVDGALLRGGRASG